MLKLSRDERLMAGRLSGAFFFVLLNGPEAILVSARQSTGQLTDQSVNQSIKRRIGPQGVVAQQRCDQDRAVDLA